MRFLSIATACCVTALAADAAAQLPGSAAVSEPRGELSSASSPGNLLGFASAYTPSPQLLERQRRLTMMQKRRDDEKARREASRAAIPTRFWNDEELAAAKFQGAHLLWLRGNTPAARRWLETILDSYPHTATAERARITLARL